jgi:outer membrane protein insertion porin family
MRQLEGAWLSNVSLERSKQRLQRLQFVESVDMTTEPVAGSSDLVDVNFAIKERPSATLGGGIGYSASQKFVLNGNVSDSNFFGGGDFVSVNVDSGAYNKIYSLSQTDPYRTVDGLSRTISPSLRPSARRTYPLA